MNGQSRARFSNRSFQTAIAVSLSTVVVLVVAAGESAGPQPSAKQSQAEVIVKRVRERLKNSQWDLVIQDCNKALAIDPNRPSALVARGRAFNGKGKFDRAIKDFDKVTQLKGRNSVAVANRADAWAHRSFSLYQQGKYLEAINSAYFAILEDGDHYEAHNHRTMAYFARSQFDKAIRSANRAIRANPDSADAYSNRGYAYGAKQNFGRAIADQDKAIELRPQFAMAYQRRGAAHAAKGDIDKASADINQALQLNPDLVEALCDRAYLFGLKRDITNALTDLDRAIKLKPGHVEAHFRRGRALLAVGNYDVANAAFDEAIRLKEDYAGAYLFRGYAYFGSENFEQAVEDFTKAISLEPELTVAYSARSKAYRKLGKGPEARADLAKLKELNSRTASKKGMDQEEPQRFQVESQPVAPEKLAQALRSAKEIDRMIQANYAKHKVTPSPKITDAQFLRRIHLDITGTIPTYPQTQIFLASKDPEKRSRLIDDLLNSDGYASHFFNYWADILRYTDNLNSTVRGEPYRQRIKQSLAENKPWDKFVHELLTAEGLIWDNPATGYLQRDSGMPLDNMNNTVRIFLGTRIGCAQCHDHPFDRWTQKQFYQMAAFTYGALTRTGGQDTRYWATNPNERLREEYDEIEQEEEDRRRNSYRFKRLVKINMTIVNDRAGRKLRLPEDYAYDNAKPKEIVAPKALFGDPAVIRAGETPRVAFARWLTSRENPRFALTIANRLWKQAFGVGQIEPVDDITDGTVAENPELMKFLESEMKRLDFDMKEYLRIIFNTETYQRRASFDEYRPGEPYHFPGPILRRMTAEQVWDSFLTLAVVKPDEYRELPSNVRTDIIGVDLTTVSAPKLLAAENAGRLVDGGRSRRQKKYKYKGVLLARASELPSPVPANHFLRMFGQSNRELISASSKVGSVPQVLFMFNGPITHMLLEKNSTIYNNVIRKRTASEGVKAIFRTVLNRDPDDAEFKLALLEIKKYGAAGYGNVIWSLVNTREFLFIQ